jgi:hypothetical protein
MAMMGSSSYKGGSRYDNTSVVISGKMRTAEEATKKAVWVWTKNKDVMTASVEGGWTTFVFTPDTKELANQWTSIARIRPLYLEGGQFLDNEKKKVAVLGQVDTGEEQQNLAALLGQAEVVVMDALDWQDCRSYLQKTWWLHFKTATQLFMQLQVLPVMHKCIWKHWRWAQMG